MPVLPPAQQPDGNGQPIEGQAWDPTTHTFVIPESGPAQTDSAEPFKYGALEVLDAQNPADNAAATSVGAFAQEQQVGTALFSPRRMASTIVNIKAQAITAGTGVSIYTPASGKKFRILGYHLSLTVAGSVLFEDGTGATSAECLRTPLLAANIGQGSPDMGLGVLSATAGNQLYIDASASGSISGWVALEAE